MPKLTWTGCEDIESAARLVGPRVRKLREARGHTLRQLAERAGISKNTVLRLEQGHPIAEAHLKRLCDVLQTVPPNLMASEADWSLPYRVHRGADAPWRIAFRRERAPAHFQDFGVVDFECERNRMGNLSFVTGFLQTLDCSIRDGKLQAAVVELYGDQEKAGYRHSGEEFIYCLQGRLKFTISSHTLILEPGDSVIFWSRYRHRYESDLPAHPGVPPTQMLMVWIEEKEDPNAVKADEECEIHDAQPEA